MINIFQSYILVVAILFFQNIFLKNIFQNKNEIFFSKNISHEKNFEKKIKNKLHAFHFTKTEITFDEKNKSLNMTLHIFIDDLEKALQHTGKEKLFIGTEKENATANQEIENYLQKNFFLDIDNKKVNYNWVGKETAKDMQAIYIYLSVEKTKNFKQIRFNNTLLTEIFPDQKNIVQLNLPNKPQGYFVFDKSHGQWTMDNK